MYILGWLPRIVFKTKQNPNYQAFSNQWLPQVHSVTRQLKAVFWVLMLKRFLGMSHGFNQTHNEKIPWKRPHFWVKGGGGLGSILFISSDQMWRAYCYDSSDLPFHLANPFWLQAPGRSKSFTHCTVEALGFFAFMKTTFGKYLRYPWIYTWHH